jgi:Recombinational DNA repair protein (RecF pathway)
MSETVYLQAGFILQSTQYRETSLLLEVLTQDFGKVKLLAKGVRKLKSKTAGVLRPFIPLYFTFTGKTELKLLTHTEIATTFTELNGWQLYCGFYINELVIHLLHLYDPYPEVFCCVSAMLIGFNP